MQQHLNVFELDFWFFEALYFLRLCPIIVGPFSTTFFYVLLKEIGLNSDFHFLEYLQL